MCAGERKIEEKDVFQFPSKSKKSCWRHDMFNFTKKRGPLPFLLSIQIGTQCTFTSF